MRAIRLAPLAALSTAAALAVAAPAAAAVPVPVPVPVTGTDAGTDSGTAAERDGGVTSFGFTVAPETVAPGGTVTLRATECSGPSVTASSGVFAPVTLAEGLSGTTTVFPEAEPGTAYDITFDCLGERGIARLLIADKSPAGREDGEAVVREPALQDSGAGAHDNTSAQKPDGGVRAGGGGSSPPPPGPERIAAGSVLVAGAVAGGAVLFTVRRRRTGHGI
ncbi:hypothetical protein [Streptomyces qinzhouensis]|uniref:Lipoprotein n=1 Tax=Streptomyces qinzhouensis TaxID=2599401 RepID=A0A5B8J5X4_9ACTN|nr:hypothetical protein [Streptomyces qinzhouensis]QDY75441.1 hypothetical protein FQU76_01750 [Streptomyces qinzhouensis]